MSLKERIYSVLVVSAAESFNTALSALLPESRYDPVRIVSHISAAKRAWSDSFYDFVIINSPLPDDPGIRFSIDIALSQGAIPLLLSGNELYDDVFDKVAKHGVFTLAKPISRSILTLTLDFMTSARERLRASEKKVLSVEEKMEEIRLVNRAKWILISELKMDEPGAHRYMEKQAMDRCVSKKTVAEEIINTYK